MKEVAALFLTLSLLLALTACGKTATPAGGASSATGAVSSAGAAATSSGAAASAGASSAASSGASSGAASSDPAAQQPGNLSGGTGTAANLPTAAQLGRETHGVVSVDLEGTTEDLPATLYIGLAPTNCAYSLYIPDKGWRLDEPGEWEATDNEDVELEIKCFSGNDLAAIRTQILREYDDFGFLDMDEDGYFSGTDGKDGLTMEVQLKTGPSETFAVLYSYPDEAAEGFGARLAGIVDTFQTEVESLAE